MKEHRNSAEATQENYLESFLYIWKDIYTFHMCIYMKKRETTLQYMIYRVFKKIDIIWDPQLISEKLI